MSIAEYSIERTAGPTSEPVTIDEAKTQARITATADDAYVLSLIKAAREQVETDARKVLTTQTFVQRLDQFPGEYIRLERTPVSSVTSITYLDSNGDSQTLSTDVWELDAKRTVPRIWLKYNQTWPVTRDIQNAVTITFVAGYGGASAVPQIAKQAMALQIGSWYRDREMTDHETRSYDALISRLRTRSYP